MIKFTFVLGNSQANIACAILNETND